MSLKYIYKSKQGVTEELVRFISHDKKEPKWMLEHRLNSLKIFKKLTLPKWGPNLSKLDLNKINYYKKAVNKQASDWSDVPADIKKTFDALGIPKAEQKSLAGTGAQYESTAIYHNLKEEVRTQGVIFEDMDVAVKKYPDLVKKYFMRCVAPSLHKFAALHGAVWSGGTFLYIPKGIKIDMPLQSYFRMNSRGMGQFEHTLIIADAKSQAHYIEGCSAPRYKVDSLHAGCVEIFVQDNAKFRYSSVENWSKDTYNLNTKRAIVERDASIEWVGGNFGSNITMLYPCSILRGQKASADHIGVAFASHGQIQDTGAQIIHAASETKSNVLMKSISQKGGESNYRGLVEILPKAKNTISNIQCDALIMDSKSISKTIPLMKIKNKTTSITHEATAGKLNEDDIFYLRSRGLSKQDAISTIVNGFIDPITKELPLEYAVEMNRLISMNNL